MMSDIEAALAALERLRLQDPSSRAESDFRFVRQTLERHRKPSITELQLKDAINILSLDNELATPDYRLANDIFAVALDNPDTPKKGFDSEIAPYSGGR